MPHMRRGIATRNLKRHMRKKTSTQRFINTCAWCGCFLATEARGFPCFGKLKSKVAMEGVFAWAIPKAAAKTVPA